MFMNIALYIIIRFNNFKCIYFILLSQCLLQANKPIEDRYAYGHLVHSNGSLFGVFDGHAGFECAQAVSERLFSYIAVAVADHDILYEIREGRIDPTKDLIFSGGSNNSEKNPNLEALHKKSLVNFAIESMATDNFDTSAKDCLVNAFRRLDRDIANEALPSKVEEPGVSFACYVDALSTALSGAVGCIAFIDGADLLVANVGDSQAVLGVLNDNCWEALPLSKTHNSDNMAEVERLFRSHPNESFNLIRNHRLFGDLVPLRAFGDIRYKWPKAELKHLLNTNTYPNTLLNLYGDMLIPKNYRTPPYLDAEPEIMHHRLTPKDKFLVLASDGLWDCLSPEKVVQLVAGHLDGQQVLVNFDPSQNDTLKSIHDVLNQRRCSLKNKTLDSNVATHLLRSALGTDHGQVSAQLTLPESMVRFYRDDITIIVIYFDSDYLKDNAAALHSVTSDKYA